MKEYDAYLFDADGTIIDTRSLICECYMAMCRTLGLPEPDRERIRETTGLPFDRQLRLVLGEDGDEELFLRAREVYSRHMGEEAGKRSLAFPGAGETLAALAGMGKKLAVVTSRSARSLPVFLETAGFSEYFSVLVTPENTERHKPDPDPALFALSRLGADARSSVFVGDAIFDILCGRAAGTDTALAAWGGMDPGEWEVQPDFVATRFSDLLPAKGGREINSDRV